MHFRPERNLLGFEQGCYIAAMPLQVGICNTHSPFAHFCSTHFFADAWGDIIQTIRLKIIKEGAPAPDGK